MIGFIVGLIIGGVVGFTLMAVLMIAREDRYDK